jgi:hypothetical protein
MKAIMPNTTDSTGYRKERIASTRNTRNSTKKNANGAGEPEYSSLFFIVLVPTFSLIPQTHLLHITDIYNPFLLIYICSEKN